MDPTEYFYQKFPDNLALFRHSIELHGSCSRRKAHQRQEFWGHRLRSALSNVLNTEGGYFSVGDLFASPTRGFPDHLADISKEDRIDYLCGLFCIILADQVMYTHFRDNYPEFLKITQYPKLDETIGWAGSLMMASPYRVLGNDVIVSRRLNATKVCERFELWARSIVTNYRKFFGEDIVATIKWPAIRHAMLSDPDCTYGQYGAILHRFLIQDVDGN